jgi:hypothetical protein
MKGQMASFVPIRVLKIRPAHYLINRKIKNKIQTRFVPPHGCMFAWPACPLCGAVYLLERLRSSGHTIPWNAFAHSDSSTESIEHGLLRIGRTFRPLQEADV